MWMLAILTTVSARKAIQAATVRAKSTTASTICAGMEALAAVLWETTSVR